MSLLRECGHGHGVPTASGATLSMDCPTRGSHVTVIHVIPITLGHMACSFQ